MPPPTIDGFQPDSFQKQSAGGFQTREVITTGGFQPNGFQSQTAGGFQMPPAILLPGGFQSDGFQSQDSGGFQMVKGVPAIAEVPQFVRDHWDVDQWGNFIPGSGIRRV